MTKRKTINMDNFIHYHNNKVIFNDASSRDPALPGIGEKIKVKIESLGKKGDGISKYNGFTVIIPEVKVGDEVEARIKNISGSKIIFAECT